MATITELQARLNDIATQAGQLHATYQERLSGLTRQKGNIAKTMAFLEKVSRLKEGQTARMVSYLERSLENPETDVLVALAHESKNTLSEDSRTLLKSYHKQILKRFEEIETRLTRVVLILSDAALDDKQLTDAVAHYLRLVANSQKITAKKLTPPPRNNPEIIQSYEKSYQAFLQLKQLTTHDNALKIGKSHERAIYLINKANAYYNQFVTEYQQLRSEQTDLDQRMGLTVREIKKSKALLALILSQYPNATDSVYVNAKTILKKVDLSERKSLKAVGDLTYLEKQGIKHSQLLKRLEQLKQTNIALKQQWLIRKQETERKLKKEAEALPELIRKQKNEIERFSGYIAQKTRKELIAQTNEFAKSAAVLKQQLHSGNSRHSFMELDRQMNLLVAQIVTRQKGLQSMLDGYIYQANERLSANIQDKAKQWVSEMAALKFDIDIKTIINLDTLKTKPKQTTEQMTQQSDALHEQKSRLNVCRGRFSIIKPVIGYLLDIKTPNKQIDTLKEFVINGTPSPLLTDIQQFTNLSSPLSHKTKTAIQIILDLHRTKRTPKAYEFLFESQAGRQAAYLLFHSIIDMKRFSRQKEIMECLLDNLSNPSFARAVCHLRNHPALLNVGFLVALATHKEPNFIHPRGAFILEQLADTHKASQYAGLLEKYFQVNHPRPLQGNDNVEQIKYKSLSILPDFSWQNAQALDILFSELDILFAEACSKDNDSKLNEALEETKREIYKRFVRSQTTWHACVEDSAQLIQTNFGDNRTLMQVILDGFARIFAMLSHLFSQDSVPEIKFTELDSEAFIQQFKNKLNGLGASYGL